MKFIPRGGWVLLVPDPPEVSSSLVLMPDNRRRKRHSGVVLIHNDPRWEDLTGQHVLFERWSYREFTLGSREYWLVPEGNCIASFAIDARTQQEIATMNRDTFIAELTTYLTDTIKADVSENRELTDDDMDTIQAMLDNTSAEQLSADIEAEDTDEDEPEAEEPANG